jgi:hypothetical protein
LEFGACGFKPLAQYRFDDELVDVYRNPLRRKRLPAVLVFRTTYNVPIVAMVFNRTEGWKSIIGLQDTKGQYKGGIDDESLSIHLPACCLDHLFQQLEVELGLLADVERMSHEESSPRHFCTPERFADVEANRSLELWILREQIVVDFWW